jgi:hypothetical protein
MGGRLGGAGGAGSWAGARQAPTGGLGYACAAATSHVPDACWAHAATGRATAPGNKRALQLLPTMSAVTGVPIMRATMPRWSSFSCKVGASW